MHPIFHIGRSYNAARASNDQIIFIFFFWLTLTFPQISDNAVVVRCTNVTGVNSVDALCGDLDLVFIARIWHSIITQLLIDYLQAVNAAIGKRLSSFNRYIIKI